MKSRIIRISRIEKIMTFPFSYYRQVCVSFSFASFIWCRLTCSEFKVNNRSDSFSISRQLILALFSTSRWFSNLWEKLFMSFTLSRQPFGTTIDPGSTYQMLSLASISTVSQSSTAKQVSYSSCESGDLSLMATEALGTVILTRLMISFCRMSWLLAVTLRTILLATEMMGVSTSTSSCSSLKMLLQKHCAEPLVRQIQKHCERLPRRARQSSLSIDHSINDNNINTIALNKLAQQVRNSRYSWKKTQQIFWINRTLFIIQYNSITQVIFLIHNNLVGALSTR